MKCVSIRKVLAMLLVPALCLGLTPGAWALVPEEPFYEEPLFEGQYFEEPLYEEPVIELPAEDEVTPAVMTPVELPIFEEPVVEELPPADEHLVETEPVVVEEPVLEEVPAEAPVSESAAAGSASGQPSEPAAPVENKTGNWGALKWSLLDGLLTISGSGPMLDLGSSDAWLPDSRNIISVKILSGVTTIGYKAFYACPNLTSVTIPESVTAIGGYAFYATGLRSIRLPSDITGIGSYCFFYCQDLKSVTLPEGVKRIGEAAFANCESLESVTLPVSLKTIGIHAFAECSSLTDVYYGGTKLQFSDISIAQFNDPLLNADIHYSSVKPGITAQPSSVTVAEGGTGTFRVTASGTGLSYQWQYRTSAGGSWKSATASGNKTATLKVPATVGRNGYQYRCRVSNSAGTVWSAAATLTVISSAEKPVISTQPGNVTISEGQTAAFRVTASGTGLSYQWQYRTSAGGSWKSATASGNKTATLKVPATVSRNGYQYRCRVSNSAGTVYSSAATLTVVE